MSDGIDDLSAGTIVVNEGPVDVSPDILETLELILSYMDEPPFHKPPQLGKAKAVLEECVKRLQGE